LFLCVFELSGLGVYRVKQKREPFGSLFF
jgi:hypothetical protein